MTGDEATHLIQVLKGLFPTITSEQAFYLKREFLKYDPWAVEAAIDLHAKVHPVVNIPRLLEQVRENGTPPHDWHNQARAEREETIADLRKIDVALSTLSDEDLKRRKET